MSEISAPKVIWLMLMEYLSIFNLVHMEPDVFWPAPPYEILILVFIPAHEQSSWGITDVRDEIEHHSVCDSEEISEISYA